MQELRVNPEPLDDSVQKPQNSVLKIVSATEPRSQRDIELIARLQAEVSILQEELERSRNEVKRYDMLLRNAKQREHELRAEMASGRKKPQD
jgi:ABC-type phosphate transport system auxiliary subunit